MSYKFSAIATLICLTFLVNSCQQDNNAANTPAIMDDSSGVIIDRSIAYAGSFETWQKKKTFPFDKKSVNYDTSGKVIRETDTHSDFVLQPSFKAKIVYKLGDTVITVIHDGQIARKKFNGKTSDKQNNIDAAWNLSFSTFYNICMPYKLKDPRSKAEYLGMVILPEGVNAHAIKINYNKGADTSSYNTWYYYFEPGSGKLLANFQEGNNNSTYSRYDVFSIAQDLAIPAKRKAYTVKELSKPGKIVVESTCTNIVFDKEFPADHFKITNGN